MPALKGSLSYSRFFVTAPLPDDFRERFMRSIRLRAMRPLEPEDEELERSGWVKLGDPFETQLSYDDVFDNGYINLGFRTDRWAIPGPMLKIRLKEAEAAYLEKKGRERLSRKEKTELKLMVSKKLRRELTPATRVVDFSWAIGEGVLRFFSHAQKPAGVMMELFKKTFSLDLMPESPYATAFRIGLSKEQETAWNELEMTYLASSTPRPARDARPEAAAEEE